MAKQYAPITDEEFEEFLGMIGHFDKVIDSNAEENVYQFRVDHPEITIRVFSTIVDGKSRAKGKDAIRVVLWHESLDQPVSGRKKTLRIGPTDSNPYGWKKNLLPKIADLLNDWEKEWAGECPDCPGNMVLRNGKYGEFFGCSNFPDCRHTEQLD